MEQLAQQCKELGNIEVRKREYTDAICHYTQGLSISPKDIDLISNRAFAYIQIGCYKSALCDIETALRLNPRHEKCLYRKVKALWGLRRYQDAVDFVDAEIPTEILNKPDFQSVVVKCHKMLKQSKGNYDIEEVMKLPRNKLNEVAEYTGPVEIAQILGKGRGLLATSDIKAGELIICSKAFTLMFEEDAKKLQAVGDIRDYCVGFICQKLSLEPTFREEVFDLYPGPSDVIPPSCKTKMTEIDKTEVGLVDSIVVYNGFSGEMDLSPWAEVTPTFLGLWILPSYINHSCMDATAYYYVYGDIMSIRAVRPIKKGQEVTICYTSPSNPERRKTIEARKFRCDCQLCLMEDSESSEVRKEVGKTLELIRAGLGSVNLDTQVSRVRKLVSIRAKYPTTNLALLDPCVEMLCAELQDKGDWKTFADIFERSHAVAENNCYVMSSVLIAINIIKCYFALGEEDLIRKWIEQLKLNLLKSYGSIEALKYLPTDITTVLTAERGFNFFDDKS